MLATWRRLSLSCLIICAGTVGAQEAIRPITAPSTSDVQAGARVQARAGGGLGLTRDITLRWGPFLVNPGIGLGLGVDATANVNSETGAARLTPGFFIDGGPALDLILPVGRSQTISFSGTAYYRYQTTRSQPSNWRYMGTFGYRLAGRRLDATLTYTLTREPETLLNFIEQGGVGATPEFADRAMTLRRTPAARIGFRLGPATTLSATATYAEVRYADAQGDTSVGDILATGLDRRELKTRIALTRAIGARSTVALVANAEQDEFRTEEGSFRDNWLYRVGLRAGFGDQLEQPLTGSIEVGVDQQNVKRAGFTDHTGPYALGRARYRILPRVGAWLRADVRTAPSIWENNIYSIQEGGGTGLDIWITRALNLGMFVDYSQIRYPEETTVSQDDGTFLTAKRKDRLLVYRADLTVIVLGRTVSLQGGYFDRRSNFDVGVSDGLFVRLGLSVGFKRNF